LAGGKSVKSVAKRSSEMKNGEVIGVCLSDERGTSKKNVGEGYLKEAHGLVGDAHAGSYKEVSLLSQEWADESFDGKETVPPGSFAENITTRGIDLSQLNVGQRLRIGESLVEVVQIGKSVEEIEGHSFSYKGLALLATRGVFVSVVKGGKVKVGNRVEIQMTKPE
jgi:MOSC domain-containing protein YiiM